MTIEVECYQMLEKKVKGSGKLTSGRVYVPKQWIGRRVKIMLLEPANEED